MLNIVIPMAGRGSRFASAGFKDPKPFIRISGLPMIEVVINNLRPECEHRFIFVCQQEHLSRYSFTERLESLAPGCCVIGLDTYSEGALCTVLAASEWIDNDQPLLIANSDQWVDTDINIFIERMRKENLDGLIMTMK
ncbi:NTP transferase domain-containing protein, partial [Enterobacter cloacae complex sp. P4RS]